MAEDTDLSEDEAALVFRRAAELEATAPGDGGRFDVVTLERIGAEAGLSPAAVRQALAELRAGRLRPPSAETTGVPRTVVVERRVPVAPAAVTERLEGYLRGQQLRVCRRLGEVTIWEPNRSLAANIARGVDLADRMRLSRVDGVELHVVDEHDGRASHVRIVLDLTKVHRGARWGRYAGGAIGLAGVAVGAGGLIIGSPEALLAVPAASAGGAGTFLGSRSTYAKHVKRAVDAVELVLDELERHRPVR